MKSEKEREKEGQSYTYPVKQEIGLMTIQVKSKR